MHLLRTLLCSCVVIPFFLQPLNAQWAQTNGPYGGHVHSLAGYKTESGQLSLFAGTYGGGIWQSSDAGGHWTPTGLVTYGVDGSMIVWSMATCTDTDGTNHVFATTYNGIYHSRDNGTTWNLTGHFIPWTYWLAASADPAGHSIIFAGSNGGVYRTTNNGDTWDTTGLMNINIRGIVAVPSANGGQTIYAGTPTDVYYSTDFGLQWTKAADSGLARIDFEKLSACPDGAGGTILLFSACCANGVFRSTNNGASWSGTTLPGLQSLASIPGSNGGIELVAATVWGGIFRSSDQGLTWSAANTGVPNTCCPAVLACPNTDGGTLLFAGTYGGVVRSTDNGIAWTDASSGIIFTTTYSLAGTVDTEGGSIVFAGTLGCGVVKSTDNGSQWSTVNTGLADIGTTEINGLVSVRTNDGNQHLYASNFSSVYHSANRGNTWEVLGPGVSNIRTVSARWLSSGHIEIVALTGHGIFRTTDNGTTWSACNTGLGTLDSYAFAVNTQQNGAESYFVGTYGGGVFRSDDSGMTWTPANTGLTNKIIYSLAVMHGAPPGNVLLAGTYNGGIFRSTDNGDTWTSVIMGLENLFVSSFAVEGSNLFAGSSAGVFYSGDLGLHWTAVNTGLKPGFSRALVILPNQTGDPELYAGTYGAGVWRRPLAEMVPAMASGWTATLTVRDGNGTGDTRALAFGRHANATDGIDEALGEADLPPAPPPVGIMDARFILPGLPSSTSMKDFRDTASQGCAWTLSYQTGSGGFPVVVSWNTASLPEGSFMLKDAAGGTIVNVNMKASGSAIIANSAVTTLIIEYSPTLAADVSAVRGWNMISVPVAAADMNVAALFPGATSSAFGFTSQYVQVTAMETGRGYWLKFDADRTFTINGVRVAPPITLPQGWSMIGAFDQPVPKNRLSTTPSGAIASQLYGYESSGYVVADTLKPGKGYWLKFSQSSQLTWTGTAKAAVIADLPASWGRIIITDRTGRCGTLYAASAGSDISRFELPPPPPEGCFDCRYRSGLSAEHLAGGRSIRVTNALYPIRIRAEGVTVRITDEIGGRLVAVELAAGKEISIGDETVTSLFVQTLEVPSAFALEQNYPNPFNPSTTIRFALPYDCRVMLDVYDMLGRHVAALASRETPAGYQETVWNATAASGLYFYRLEAVPLSDPGKRFVKTMKMILVR